jgi:hypothetical protein
MEFGGSSLSLYPFALKGETLADSTYDANLLPFYLQLKIYANIINRRIKTSFWREATMKIVMYRCPKCNRVKQFSVWRYLSREELSRLNYVDVEFKFVQCDMC